ncbi:MAG: MarR family transcriptional regulator [Nitrospinota bacterium]|nr:MarR family transcriptional regulator [Nitrospinota bacterium]
MVIDFSDTIGRYLSITCRRLSARMARRLAPHEIGAGQFPILFTLYIEEGLTQKEIALRTALDKAAVARAVTALEKEGYVKRHPDGKDRRAVQVRLTGKARRLRPKLEAAAAGEMAILQAGLSPQERTELKRLLKAVARNAGEKMDI